MNETGDNKQGRAHLLVQAGEVVCALPLDAVRRVVKALTVHRLPGAAGELSGLAEFAGEPMPVLDLGRLVGAAPGASPAYPITVIAWAGRAESRELIGLSADAALEVVPIDLAGVVSVEAGPVAGEAQVGDEVVRVLDLVALGHAEALP
ncbi:MAG TPA: chemotaxis protein CheW [Thermoanaerobaculia bacterium]|nr:chemotaxis protein CheW [Thermoanaerobaculia bacterium]